MQSSADFRILSGTAAQLGADTVAALARYRHRVFVQRLGWQLSGGQGGMELDQFDRSDTLYLAARRPDGAIAGMARLLPTLRPYLLGEVFPQLMGGHPPPRSARVWELSRFAAFDPECDGASGACGALSSPLAVELLRAALHRAGETGVRHLITVSPPGIGRLLRRSGFSARAAGEPQWLQGHLLVAYWIATSQRAHEAPAPASDPVQACALPCGSVP